MAARKSTGLVFVLLCIFLAMPAFANIDNLSNMSAEWIRTGNRNAATDAADIVVYNPAGLTEMKDGLHVNLGNQTLIRKPEHSFNLGAGQKSYEQDSADLWLPNLYGAYKKDVWAVYAGVYVPGGGAVVDYPNGSITTQLAGASVLASAADPALAPFGISTIGDIYAGFANESLEATSMYLTTTIGGTYRINKKVSVSGGLRYIDAKNTVKAQLTLTGLSATAQAVNTAAPGTIADSQTLKIDEEETADGLGGILGINLNLSDRMNAALTYQTRVRLNFETQVNRDDIGMFIQGAKNRRDFPAFLGIGLGYDFSDKVRSEMNAGYWFQKDADWGTDTTGRDISDMAGDAWSIGCAVSYTIIPKILISAGTTFTKFNWGDMSGYYNAALGSKEVLYSDNWHLGLGGAWEFKENMRFNLALGRTLWKDETIQQNVGAATVPVQTQNATTTIALGVDLAF